jgi:hypothetical protein
LTPSPEGHHPRCKVDPWIPNVEADTLIFNFGGTPFGTAKYEIIPRSTFGIYQFLGRILALQQADAFVLRGTLYEREDRRILAVERSGTGGCLVDVSFEEEYYCVPLNGAQNTKRIMGLLAQLVALNTTTLDLAITPTVRAVQEACGHASSHARACQKNAASSVRPRPWNVCLRWRGGCNAASLSNRHDGGAILVERAALPRGPRTPHHDGAGLAA